MKKLLDAIYGLAIILIFGTALLADGLADMPGGFVIMSRPSRPQAFSLASGTAWRLHSAGSHERDREPETPLIYLILPSIHRIYKPNK